MFWFPITTFDFTTSPQIVIPPWLLLLTLELMSPELLDTPLTSGLPALQVGDLISFAHL
jgi:hypothetical protein